MNTELNKYCSKYCSFVKNTVENTEYLLLEIEGSEPEWYISSM